MRDVRDVRVEYPEPAVANAHSLREDAIESLRNSELPKAEALGFRGSAVGFVPA